MILTRFRPLLCVVLYYHYIYSPRVEAGKHTLPGHKTPLEGLYLTGDYTFPGIGVPATAASGAVTANTLVSVQQHNAMLDKIKLPIK